MQRMNTTTTSLQNLRQRHPLLFLLVHKTLQRRHPPHETANPNYPDDSIPLQYPRHKGSLHDFIVALAVLVTFFSFSRVLYAAMKQVLRLLPRDVDSLNSLLDDIPDTVDTLKQRAFGSIPLIEMRSKNVPLNARKIPTDRPTRGGREAAENDVASPSEDMFFLDPIDMFKAILSSPLPSRMHFGLAVLVDSPTEFWNSHAWAQSIRTTSGEFAR